MNQNREMLAALDRGLDNVGVALLVTDAAGRITLINRTAEELLGGGVGEPLSRLLRLEDGETLQPVKCPPETEPSVGQIKVHEDPLVLRTIKSGRHEVLVSAVPLEAAGGSGTLVLVRDVTVPRQERARTTQLEHRLASILRAAPCGLGLVQDTILEEVNGRLCDMLGCVPDDLLGQGIRTLYSTAEACEQARRQQHDQMAATGTGSVQTRWRRKDGSELDVLLSSTPLVPDDPSRGEVFTALDITEHKLDQERLRASESRYRELFEHSPVGVITVARDGTILDVNPAMLAILGSPSAKATRTINLLTFPPLVLAGISADFIRCIETGERMVCDHLYTSKWGKASHLRYHLNPLFDESGQAAGLQASVEDFTAFKKAQEEGARLTEQLRQSQKMEAIGRLAGGVAHDFNNILTGIRGYAEVILSNFDPSDPTHADLMEILRAAEQAAALTRQLLAFSRKQVICPQVIQLDQIIDQSRRMLGRIIGEDIKLVFSPGGDLWPVKVDPQQVDQILVNLAVNARDAMPDGGRLILGASNVTLDKEYAQVIPDLAPGDYVMLSMTDTGSGMDEKTRSHVFEPFFSTKEPGRGTGLGLATVYGIVKQNSGHIELFSEVGLGTTFRIYFPRVMAIPVSTKRPRTVALPVGPETVLLVEDEEIVRRLARRILQQQGYTVLEAMDGEDALQLSKLHQGTIHLLLSDVVMPGLSGPDLFERLREERPLLKVIFMSGYPSDVIARRGGLGKGAAFLQKPFTVEGLTRMLRQVLDQ